jgi:hypothetical protein
LLVAMRSPPFNEGTYTNRSNAAASSLICCRLTGIHGFPSLGNEN